MIMYTLYDEHVMIVDIVSTVITLIIVNVSQGRV